MDQKRLQLFDSAPVQRALLLMGLPTMLGMLINALYNLADACFVAGLGSSQLAAISVAYPIGQVLVGLGLLFGNGAASYCSRLLGGGQKEKANAVACTALFGSLLCGAAAAALTAGCLRPLLRLLHASENVMPYALSYTRIFIFGSILNILNVAMNNLASSEGAAQTTMFVLLSGALLNVALDPVFIYVFGFGISGAALATVLSQGFSALAYLFYLRSGKSVFCIRVKSCCFTWEVLSEILKIGIPTLLFQLLASVSIILVNRQASGYGDSAVAAMGAVTRVSSIGSLMVFGFLKGFQPIAGYSYGAGRWDRLRETIRTAVCWSTVFCLLAGLSAACFAKPILSGFAKDDPAILSAGTEALRASGIAFIPFGFHTVYSFLFLAMGKAKEGLFLGCCRQGLCFVPMILLLPCFLGLRGILYAQPAADLLAALVTIPFAARIFREQLPKSFL